MTTQQEFFGACFFAAVCGYCLASGYWLGAVLNGSAAYLWFDNATAELRGLVQGDGE